MPVLIFFFAHPPYDFALPLFKLHPLARAAVPQIVLNPAGYGICTHVRGVLASAAWRRLCMEAAFRTRQYLCNLSGSVAQ